MFVIQRNDGAYGSRSGSAHSYTRKLETARTWRTREAAQSECCENERVIRVDDLIGRG